MKWCKLKETLCKIGERERVQLMTKMKVVEKPTPQKEEDRPPQDSETSDEVDIDEAIVDVTSQVYLLVSILFLKLTFHLDFNSIT